MKPACYQLHVRGILDSRWSAWFDGLTITPDANGDTTLQGRFTDQGALYGVISKLRDLGLELLAVERCNAETPRAPEG
jgi:hypothetical protein